jgi:hypothetical protein
VAAYTILLCIWPWYESRGNSAPFWIRTSVIWNDFYWNLDTSGACHIAIYLALVLWVKRKQWTFMNSNKRHSKWLLSKHGAIDCFWLFPSVSSSHYYHFSSCSWYTRIKVQLDRWYSCLSSQQLCNHFCHALKWMIQQKKDDGIPLS